MATPNEYVHYNLLPCSMAHNPLYHIKTDEALLHYRLNPLEAHSLPCYLDWLSYGIFQMAYRHCLQSYILTQPELIS